MNRHVSLAVLALLCVASWCTAQTTAPSDSTAAQALKDSPRHGEWVDIAMPGGDVKLHTWVVYPERKDKAPVVLVIHEIFGMTDWVRSVADALAAEGFIAVAPDFLSGFGPNGGGSESLGGDVRSAISKLSQDEIAKRLDVARDYALKLPSADGKSGSIGFCWGGGASFNYAARQPALDAAVVYYGTAPTDKAMLEKIKCPVIGFYGGDDARVTSTVKPTSDTLDAMGKSYEANVFDGAGHGFLRQQSGRDGANEKAAEKAWGMTVKFLHEHLEK